MFFEHVFERGLAQSSYVVGCQATGNAIVIDPKRDIDTYLTIAEREGLKITHVTETHIHADYLSGARELSQATGAELLLSDEGGSDWQYDMPHTGLRDGDVIHIGNIRLDVVHTPGHTPEHVSFVLFDLPAGDQPRMIFTGDFVFVGDVGRPDLLEAAAGVVGSREVGAHQMYGSLRRIADLPDHVLVWPGHGAGSACGKSLGAVPVSTLGFERATSWAFHHADEDAFVEDLLDGQPEPPRYFATMKRLNRSRGAETVHPTLPNVPEWSGATLAAERDARADRGEELQIVDLRDAEDFATTPVAGALNIPLDQGISTWFGWFLDYERDIALVVEESNVDEVRRALVRIGLDRVVGWSSPQEVKNTSALLDPNGTVNHVSPEEAQRLREAGAMVLDVRSDAEYREDHIAGAHHLYLGYIPERHSEIPADTPVVVHCQSGYRSSIAASLLRRNGFNAVYNLSGGFEAWREVYHPEPIGS